MSFGDLLTRLINTQQEKGVKTTLAKVEGTDIKQVTVTPEDCILTDEEFEAFMKENTHLIYEDDK